MECGYGVLEYPNGMNCEPGCKDATFDGDDVTAEKCHQLCLERPSCKAFNWDNINRFIGDPACRLYNVSLGQNGTNINGPHVSPTESPQWWDRNCQTHLPTDCARSASKTIAPEMQITAAPNFVPREVPTITDAPSDDEVGQQDLLRRDPGEVSIPSYIYWLVYPFATKYLTPACSCAITSARPPVSATKTLTFSTYTSKTVCRLKL